MSGIAHCGDFWVGICICEIGSPPSFGPIISCSSDAIADNRGIARHLDITICPNGHVGSIVTSSGDTEINNRGAARCGDLVAGCNIGTIAICSSSAFSD